MRHPANRGDRKALTAKQGARRAFIIGVNTGRKLQRETEARYELTRSQTCFCNKRVTAEKRADL